MPFKSLCFLALHDEPISKSKSLLRGLGIDPSDSKESTPKLIGELAAKLKSFVGESDLEKLYDGRLLRESARRMLVEMALSKTSSLPEGNEGGEDPTEKRRKAILLLADLYDPEIPTLNEIISDSPEDAEAIAKGWYKREPGKSFTPEEINELLARSFVYQDKHAADILIRGMTFARFAQLDGIDDLPEQLYGFGRVSKGWLIAPVVLLMLILSFFFVEANSTSLHSFYRNRLGHAFLTKTSANRKGVVEPDVNVKLSELCNYQEGNSNSPYHLINAAINMQNSGLETLRDRNADFFLFSKLYVGGRYTGYIETSEFERFAPQFNTASAMAVSGAAASPNMGKYTHGLLTFLLTVLNVRRGYWIPNPNKIRTQHNDSNNLTRLKSRTATCDFEKVWPTEFEQIRIARYNKAQNGATQPKKVPIREIWTDKLTVDNNLLGIALSGGGVRSAAINLGILQAIDEIGLFQDVDYLSTVSGGGYVGTAISTFMRERNASRPAADPENETRDSAILRIENACRDLAAAFTNAFKRFAWMPKFWLLYYEMFGKLDHKQKWVNVSDGGHVENLGVFELLRRRCSIIIVGDGEADPHGVMDGLSGLMRIAEVDGGIRIEFPNESLESFKNNNPIGRSSGTKEREGSEPELQRTHFATANIHYPPLKNQPAEQGMLLYLKSSLIGDEDQVIENYRAMNPSFPHQTTADQLFDEGQFEAYRRLGYKIASSASTALGRGGAISDFASLSECLATMLKKD